MFARQKSFSILYGIQRSFLNLFYLISVVAVFWLIFYILHDVLGKGGNIIIPVSIVYLVLIVLLYSFIHVISYIPANLAGAFDPVKNDIADGNIKSAEDLSGRLADFICSFFNFAFFDAEFAIVHLEGRLPVCSNNLDLAGSGLDTSQLEKETLALEETRYYGKLKTTLGYQYVYLIPLIFGGKRLGHIVIGARQKLWKIFIQLLNELENDYLDDQVVHVLSREDNPNS